MRALRLILCCACLLSWAPLPAHASKQDDLEKLRARIQSMRQEVEKTSESRNEAADALRDSETAISNHKRKLFELGQQRQHTEKELQQLDDESHQIRRRLNDQQGRLESLLYQQYTSGRPNYLQLVLGNRDPNQLSRDVQYYNYIAHSRADWLASLHDDLDRLSQVAAETEQKNQHIAALQTEAEQQHRNLEKEKLNRARVLSNISSELSKKRRDLGQLQRDEARLTKLVERLAKMLAEPGKPKPAKPAEKDRKNNATPDNRYDGQEFAGLQGHLALPVAGKLTNQFGAARADSSLPWKGLFMSAPAGQPVKAIAAGQVVFADWLRGFGNLIIVDHGHGYMSLYGNNEALLKQVGDKLHGGDTIASVGNSGGNETSGLYFEVRYEGKPVDPMRWVSVR